MNRKFRWTILLLTLILLLSACRNDQNPEKGSSDSTDDVTQGTEDPNQNTTSDPTIPGGYEEQTSFGFAYEHTAGTPKRGQSITIKTTLTNISGQPYTYIGSYGSFMAHAFVYCEADTGQYFVDCHFALPDDLDATHTIAAGESSSQTFFFNIPESAPSGEYHLRLNYDTESVTFYNIFTL